MWLRTYRFFFKSTSKCWLKQYKLNPLFWVLASLGLDNLTLPHESSWDQLGHVLLFALLDSEAVLGAAHWPLEPALQPRLHSQPRRPEGGPGLLTPVCSLL